MSEGLSGIYSDFAARSDGFFNFVYYQSPHRCLHGDRKRCPRTPCSSCWHVCSRQWIPWFWCWHVVYQKHITVGTKRVRCATVPFQQKNSELPGGNIITVGVKHQPACPIVVDDRLFVFGGCTDPGGLARDVEYLGTDHKWSLAENVCNVVSLTYSGRETRSIPSRMLAVFENIRYRSTDSSCTKSWSLARVFD